VTLPDWQGIGLASALNDALGSAYRAVGKRLHAYPAHPSRVRALDRSPRWAMKKRPGTFSPAAGATSTARMGGRPCAVFEYVGPAMADRQQALRLLGAG
jgi:hypothetical protein